jgi:hypothetical protein
MTLGQILFELRATQNDNGQTEGRPRVNLNPLPFPGGGTKSKIFQTSFSCYLFSSILNNCAINQWWVRETRVQRNWHQQLEAALKWTLINNMNSNIFFIKWTRNVSSHHGSPPHATKISNVKIFSSKFVCTNFFFYLKFKDLKTIQCWHKPFLYKVQGTETIPC